MLRPRARDMVRYVAVADVRQDLEDHRADVLVVDWEPNGETALALLGDEAVVRSRVPVLVVGGPQGEETRRRVLDAGAADHVPAAELDRSTLARSVRLLTDLGRLRREALAASSWDVTELYRAREALEARAGELQERVKEMACLSRMTEILLEPEGDWSTRLTRVADTIPGGFRFPDSMAARVTIEDQRHPSRGYREAGEALSVPVVVEGERVGDVEVRLVSRPEELAGGRPFLPEEHDLLQSIALRLGEAIWRRRATASLQRSEAYFRTVAERAGVIMGVTDRDGRVHYASEGVRSLLGKEVEEVVGSTTPELVVPEDRPEVLALLEASLANPTETVEGQVRVETTDGRKRHVEVTIRNLLEEPAVGGLVVTARDVTERVRQEQRIQLQADLLDSVGQAVMASDPEGRVIYWNRAAEAIYGWSREEVLGRLILDVLPTAETRTSAAEVLEGLRRGEPWSGEMELRRKDGTTFPALVTNAPVLARDGQITGIISVSADLTERKALDEQLMQVQRMEAIGRLAGGVAHDFNNLLTVIGGHCSLAAGRVEPGSAVHRHLEEVEDAVQRASKLTGQLLAFSRKQYLDEKVFDLRDRVGAMESVLRRLIPERIAVDFDLGSEPCWIRADPGQLDQIVLNLAVNAKDAIEAEGRITIRVEEKVLSERQAEEFPWQARPGRYATLTISDTGIGIPASSLDRIFEPFFTTKPVGQGTGLGLSMVYGTVKRAEGHVMVESAPGEGATFRILLPYSEPEQTEVPDEGGREETATVERARYGATLLLVEDDPAVRSLLKDVLEQRGCRVLLAGNGREALEMLAAHEGDVQVVVSDVVMPELGGVALADHLQESYPDIHFILMSGYPHEELPAATRDAAAAFLRKPFSPEDLARTVLRILD